MRALSFLLLALVLAPCASAQRSLYADAKARVPGDVITIVLAERTAAQRASAYDERSEAGLAAGAQVDGGALNGRFAADASFASNQRSRNESVQSDLLQGTVAALVVEVDSVGNLVIAGERRLSVNGATHLMRVSGRVRPLDVSSSNTVLSYQIADATIVYEQKGLARSRFRPGFFAKVGAVAALAAAVVFAAQ